MSGVDLAELRRLAEQALMQPDPAALASARVDVRIRAVEAREKLIAACDPGTVLALVEAVEAAHECADAAIWLTGLPCLGPESEAWPHFESTARPQIHALLAALAPFTVALGEGDRAAVSSSPSAGDSDG